MMDIDRQMAVIKRGVAELIDEKELRKKLERGTPLRVKVGFDPTAPDLHLGHTVVMHKMRHFQELGHQIIFLIVIFVGATMDLSLAWSIADTLNGLMALPNLIALVALSGVVVKETKRHFSEVKK